MLNLRSIYAYRSYINVTTYFSAYIFGRPDFYSFYYPFGLDAIIGGFLFRNQNCTRNTAFVPNECSASYNRYFVLPYYYYFVVVLLLNSFGWSTLSVPISRPVRVLLSDFFLLLVLLFQPPLFIVLDLHHKTNNRDHPTRSFDCIDPSLHRFFRVIRYLFSSLYVSFYLVLLLRPLTPTGTATPILDHGIGIAPFSIAKIAEGQRHTPPPLIPFVYHHHTYHILTI